MVTIEGSTNRSIPCLLEYPEILKKTVKMINVGTHSNTIENSLRCYFSDLGWTCTFDIPINSKVRFEMNKGQGAGNPDKIKEITFGDGVQVWINNSVS